MSKLFYLLTSSYFLLAPAISFAHGLIPDEHPESISLTEYIEIGGLALVSIGMILFTVNRLRNERKKEKE
ncbi:MAG TPA: hypothetical protein VEC17_00485 [Candidatus Binatia bacterium]|nr:hypothetical protein [Candidatus Binatia bacterium]